ncbi:unnamed protein product [Owenia fusiformis]|uniref:protein-lysine 6-oxidase n=1 Tax=Owenia fusiformis TaxID=6347 RepID=A0A8J1T5P2_OWEFU|nr:unnamed protein product [Owenia fusiformis]
MHLPLKYSGLILMTICVTVIAIKDGHIRLVGGSDHRRGNVLIWHALQWGSVCDDRWSIENAHVVCKQLGFPSAVSTTEFGQYGRARRLIWLDNVVCKGSEDTLANCTHDPWGKHDCGRDEAAGVVCNRKPITTPKPSPDPFIDLMPVFKVESSDEDTASNSAIETEGYEIRLAGGRNPKEGRIEVKIDGKWGVICGYQFGMLEAMVACKQLGLGYARVPIQQSFFGGEDLDKVINGIKCMGTESNLAECFHLETLRSVVCPKKEFIAGAICTSTLPDLVPNATLLEQSMHLQDRSLYHLQCSMEENCLSQDAYDLRETQPRTWHLASRRLLRFSSVIHNNGTSDFHPHLSKEDWEWHLCHMHYHSMDVFAHYDIMDYHGNRVAQGHKASFCLEDVECYPGYEKKYSCTNFGDQGISVGCADRYNHDIDCQWIDMTSTPEGNYLFKLNVNPQYLVAELDYDNNAVLCNFDYSGHSVSLYNCTIEHGQKTLVNG